MDQDNRVLSQQVENLKARQALNQLSIQETKEKVDEKFNQLVQPVTLTTPIYFLPDGSLAPAAGALEGQQAFDGLGDQPGAELYPESQQSRTRDHTKTGEVDSLLNSSTETLPTVPKTPDTSFESKQQGTWPEVGATQADARLEPGEREQPGQRGLEEEGDHIPSEVWQQKDTEKATQPLSEPHPEGWDTRQPASAEPSSGKGEAAPPVVEPQLKARK